MPHTLRRVTRALLSVSDKSGLIEFARALAAHGVELVSTGGTAKAIAEAGLKVRDVSELTGFPEMMDGRVKTLHPKVHGGLLAIRGNAEHSEAMTAHGIAAIDLLVVNLYPFEATVEKGADFTDCIENIDIGGPAMIRAAAKNHDDVAVVVEAADYTDILDELAANKGATTLQLRRRLAAKNRHNIITMVLYLLKQWFAFYVTFLIGLIALDFYDSLGAVVFPIALLAAAIFMTAYCSYSPGVGGVSRPLTRVVAE